MSPLDRRRRRRILGARARTLLVPALVAAVVVVVVVGGVLEIGAQSASYWRAVDRSFAAQARALGAQATHADAELSSLLVTVPHRDRPQLEAMLDTLVRSSTDLARAAATAASPPPAGGAGREVATAFSERAQAMVDLRTAVDGLLEMSPLPVPGSAVTSVRPVTTVEAAPLSAPSAVAALVRVGALLQASDRTYSAARRSLRAAPGHAELPASAWASGAPSAWTSGSPQALVDAIGAAPGLAVVHRVALLVDDVGMTPAALPGAGAAPPPPSASGAAAPSTIPPTHHLAINAVVADQGNVPEPGVVVSAELQAAAGGSISKSARTVTLAAGGSVAVTLGGLGVVPGDDYTVTLTVTPPSGEPPATPPLTFAVAVAPPSPPSVLAVTPASGSRAGGSVVTVAGTGFTSVTAVSFGSAPARFSILSSTQIRATAPPGAGTVTVSVTDPGGTSPASSAARFTYTGRPKGGA